MLLTIITVNATVKEDFLKANDLYSEGDYEESKEGYLALLEAGHYSSELYYNLGNVCYKLHEVASSIYYYEKAKKLNPLNEDIQHNLSFANQLIVDKPDELEDEILSAWWGSLVKYQPLNRWALYSVLFTLLGAGAFVCFLFATNRAMKQASFYIAIGGVVLFMMVMLIGYQSKSIMETTSHAIVFSPSVTVTSEPSNNGAKLFTLHEGAKVELLIEENGWARIQYSDSKQGWVKGEAVKGI